MAKLSLAQNAFNSGELSPRMDGRFDIQKYGLGVKALLNFIIQPEGGAIRRSGARFVAEVDDSTVKSRLKEFIFSTTQAYILEFTELLMRVFRNEGIVLDGAVPFELVTPYAEADLYDLQFAQSADVLYVVHPDYRPAKISRTGHTAWTHDFIDFQDGPYLDQNTTAITVDPDGVSGTVTLTASTALFAESDNGRLFRYYDDNEDEWFWGVLSNFVNSTTIDWTIQAVTGSEAAVADTMGAHGATADWRLGAWGSAAALGYPSVVSFYEQRLCYSAAPGGPQTIDASVTADYEHFAPTNAAGTVTDDKAFRYTLAANQVNVIRWTRPIRSMLIGTTGGIWAMQAAPITDPITPSNVNIRRTSVNGAGTPEPVEVDDRAIYTSNSARKVLSVGYAFETDSYGTEDLTLFADHIGAEKLVMLAYAQEPNRVIWAVREDGMLAGLTYHRAQEVVGWHRHIIGGSFGAGEAVVESIAVIPAPNEDHDQLWLSVKRTIDGATYRSVEFLEQDFADGDDQESAFFVDSGLSLNLPVTITGATAADPVVISAAAHGFSNGDSVRITHIEGMTELNRRSFTVANAAGGTFELSGEDGTGHTAYISGGEARKKEISVEVTVPGHLEGETVQVLADGAPVPDEVVDSGVITLATAASEIHAGLGYNTDLEPLRPSPFEQGASPQGTMKRVIAAIFRFVNSLGGKIGPDEDNLTPIIFREGGDPMDEPPPLFSGDMEELVDAASDPDSFVMFRQDQPLPTNIVALTLRTEVSDR